MKLASSSSLVLSLLPLAQAFLLPSLPSTLRTTRGSAPLSMSSLLLDENAVADRIKDGLLIRHMPEVRREGGRDGGRGGEGGGGGRERGRKGAAFRA